MFRRLQARSGGLIKLVDVAPEEPGNLDFIRDCHNEVCISIAHTCTDYDTAKAAFAAGASHMTHLYNAMPGITHRAPGPIIAALEDGADVELITDNAVSYTHLDVYKRQPPPRRPAGPARLCGRGQTHARRLILFSASCFPLFIATFIS